VLAYIANTLVKLMTRRWNRRRLNVVVVFVLFLAMLIGAGVLVVPKMFSEVRQLAVFSIARDAAAQPQITTTQPRDGETAIDREARRYVDSILIRLVGPATFRSFERSEAYEGLMQRVDAAISGFLPRVIGAVRAFVNSSLAIFLQFLLSIVLSFLILWDLPSLERGVESLASGRTADVYAEIAPSITAFGMMLGRAFEAQTLIAVVNAILTSIGFLILGIPSIALLATIVFFCSYVPVVGVMLSTLPAALFAFKTGGITLVLWLVVMVLLVHAVEAYMLNPIIYGRHMKMHPVAILVILMVGEHLFGIWGLLLGVPMAAFVWTYLIQGKDVGAAAKPLTTAPVEDQSPS
jgi:predicted PurR-regulated permease PerM